MAKELNTVMKRRAAALLIALLAAGCTPGSTPGLPAEPVPPATGPTAGDSEAATPQLPVQTGAQGLNHVTYDSTMAISSTGLYVVNVTTGKVEGWALADQVPEDPAHLRLSEDGHWIVAETRGRVLWVNRESGAGFQWAPGELRHLGTGAGGLLFQELKDGRPTGGFFVTDDSLQVKQTFTLGTEAEQALAARFSPDGKSLAIALWVPQAGSGGAGSVHLVDLATGESRRIDEVSPSAEDAPVSVDLLGGAASDELMIAYHLQRVEPSGLVQVHTALRRFDWRGTLLGEYTVDGTAQQLSPDGKLLLAYQDLAHLAPAALVVDAASGEPHFRVAGASGEEWLADGSAILVNSGHGYQLATRSAELQAVLTIPDTEGWAALPSVEPAPDNPDLFAYGLAAFDQSGELVRELKLPRRDDWLVWGASWGASADELVIPITSPIGKGNPGTQPVLPVQVQEPPFADPYLLQVQDPKGECLNLRAASATSGKVIRCLPTGTKLGVGDFMLAPVKLNSAAYWADNQIWFWVQTEQGETGWVSASAGSLVWAE